MSRIIYLRSPYFVKASASEGKTLTAAQLDLYIWKGDLTDAPTEPIRSLQKSTENSGKNYVTFEIASICRDEIDVLFDGINRDSEPIYINTELSQTYSDGTSEIYSNIVFGLDGYKNFEEGPQVTENLWKDPSTIDVVDEDEKIIISITDEITGTADRKFKTGADLTLTATYEPSTATLQWFKDNVVIANQVGSTYTIFNADTDDDATYFCRATLNAGDDDEYYEDSNDIVYTLEDCPPIYFNPDAQGSSYLSAGGEVGTTISVDVIYNTDCYDLIATADVKMANGDASPFTITSVTTVDQGDDKKTTVLLTTKGKNTGSSSAKQDRLIIRYTEIGKLEVPKNINVQQLAAAGALHSLSFVGKSEGDHTAKDVEFIVSGTVGTKYSILVLPRYYDRDNDGKITDEPDYEWISQSNLDSLTGTIEADGQNNHTISLTENDIAYQRSFNLVAVNDDDATNRAVSTYYIQDNFADYAFLQLTDVDFTDATEEDMDVTYYSNTPVEIRITKTPEGFRIVQPELSDPGPPKVVFVEETETSVIYRGESGAAGTTFTVRCKPNEGKIREGRVSIYFKSGGPEQDTVTLTQPGTDDFCIWQSFIDKSSNRTPLNALNIGAARNNGAFGYFIEINSSVPWSVAVPDGISIRGNASDSSGYGEDIKGLPGEWSYFLNTEEDNPSTDPRTFDLVLTSDDPDFTSSETLTVTQAGSAQLSDDAPVFDSITLYEATRETVLADWVLGTDVVEFDAPVYGRAVTKGYGLQAVASDTNAGDIEYQWYRKFAFTDSLIKVFTVDDTFFFTPASAGELTYQCLVTNTTTGLSRYSDEIVLTVKANEGAGVVDWVQSPDITEDAFGNKTINVPHTGGTYELNIVDIADTQTWRWNFTDYSQDLVVPNNSLGTDEESYMGTGQGPQTVTTTFSKNTSILQKFINLGFYDGPSGNPNVIVKFNQAGKPYEYTNTPTIVIPGLSNSTSNNANDNQNNGSNPADTVEEDQTLLLQNLENEIILGNVGGGNVITETITQVPNNQVIEASNEVVADANIENVISDIANIIEQLNNNTLPVLNDVVEGDQDNGNNKVDTIESPVITPPVLGGGGGGFKPKPYEPSDPFEKGFGDKEK